MTETRISFLYKIASSFQQSNTNESILRLRSFYLMRCKEITGGYGLPSKHFSKNARCPHCCLEWNNKADVKIKPIKFSGRQKQRIRSKKESLNEKKTNFKKALLKSNQMEQVCSFCKHTTATILPKVANEYPKKVETTEPVSKNIQGKKKQDNLTRETKSDSNKSKLTMKNKIESTKKNISNTNVYSNAFDVFSLKKNQNTLASTVKNTPKVIKNNKRKKDKFAGLCQKAVLASVKANQDKGWDKKQNKLSLFLKQSSG